MTTIGRRLWGRRHTLEFIGRFTARSLSAVGAQFQDERARWALWMPVFMGAGIAIYFALAVEPPVWLGFALIVASGVLLAMFRGHPIWWLGIAAIAVAALGFARAQIQTVLVDAPVLAKKLGPVSVTGEVARLEPMERGVRLHMTDLLIGRLPAARTPARIRVRVRKLGDPVAAGDRVRVTAILMPPPGPSAPGAYDFARRAYFARVGAVGFVLGRPKVTAKSGGWSTALARLRQTATRRILDGLDTPSGSVAAALMTGARRSIPEDVLAAMRVSGLAHLLAISGLHIGLVAGILFLGLRVGLASIGSLALRYPIKKWAAVGAALGALGYLLISGATVPTQRAFLMTLVVLVAVMLDRTAISMRLVAWAAAVVLMIAPESLLTASFQMSFAAVIALVAAYEVMSPKFSDWRRGGGWGRTALLYLGGILMTTLVASAATAPFAAFHFNRIALYGIAANLLAVPLTGFWIMPWAILAFALMPFGLESWALVPMGWGIDGVIAIAREIAGWPGGVKHVIAAPVAALCLAALGGLWLCLWRGSWRFFGIAGFVGAVLLAATVRPPDILIDGRGTMVAARLKDGSYALTPGKRDSFGAGMWLRRAGQTGVTDFPRRGRDPTGQIACDRLGCVLSISGRRVTIARHRAALDEDCRASDIVLALVPVRPRFCRGPELLIRRYDLYRNGAHAIWLRDGTVRVEHVRATGGDRPWRGKPKKRRFVRKPDRLNSGGSARRAGLGP